MRIAVFILLILSLASRISAQDAAASSSEERPLAVASIHVAKHKFKSGEDIDVTLLLEAGPQGVYVAKNWGGAGGGIPGFFLLLESRYGRAGQTCGVAGEALPIAEPDAAKILDRNFIFLGSGQIIGWRTKILCPTHRRGKYWIRATYNPGLHSTNRVAELPETRGLVLAKPVDAKPEEISIY